MSFSISILSNYIVKNLSPVFYLRKICHINNSKLFCNQAAQTVTFEDVKAQTRDKNVIIIDVREPQELIDYGVIPGSVNIPSILVGNVENVLKNLTEEQFMQTFGKEKPIPSKPIIFTCMRGVRSAKAQNIAYQLGYQNVKNYTGGWIDWIENLNKNK